MKSRLPVRDVQSPRVISPPHPDWKQQDLTGTIRSFLLLKRKNADDINDVAGGVQLASHKRTHVGSTVLPACCPRITRQTQPFCDLTIFRPVLLKVLG